MTTEPEEEFEEEVTKCPECGQDVTTLWLKNGRGCLSRPEYVLIADWVFHSECWDKLVERNPP